jgi:hypothetical protein
MGDGRVPSDVRRSERRKGVTGCMVRRRGDVVRVQGHAHQNSGRVS